jgi:hypothetical protein
MRLEEWLAAMPILAEPGGARLSLRLYVYPDGRGAFFVEDAFGRVCGEGQSVENPQEAVRLLERIWGRAVQVRVEPQPDSTAEKTLADQFSDVIGAAPDLPPDMAANHDRHLHGTPKP